MQPHTKHKVVSLELNRVEGDLEVKIEYDGEKVTDAWCIGLMYRGFEQILRGRAATDGLVITPRICGICSTSHSYAAVAALEHAWQCPIAPNGTRVRNLCLMTEGIQSDARHSFLMFTIDLCNPRYRDVEGYDRVQTLFEAFSGRTYVETLQRTKDILKIVAIFGGQWPHSGSFMPGGVTARPTRAQLRRARDLINEYQGWYEASVLGCRTERWLRNHTADDVEAWLDEAVAHRKSAIGTFWRFTRAIGLHRTGVGEGNLLSFGNYFDPVRWQPPFEEPAMLLPGGFHDAETGLDSPFDHREVTEHVRYSHFVDSGDGRHPWQGETSPVAGPRDGSYSWAKAPRYRGKVCELGPLADLYHGGDPLVRGLFAAEGSNSFLRQFARIHRAAPTFELMHRTLDELVADLDEPFLIRPTPRATAQGVGFVSAARGGLAHWIELVDGEIERYQIITPTSWNASPRDSAGTPGHWESTMIGTPIADLEDPIELAHIIRSHDACLVCTVHVLDLDRRFRFGAA